MADCILAALNGSDCIDDPTGGWLYADVCEFDDVDTVTYDGTDTSLQKYSRGIITLNRVYINEPVMLPFASLTTTGPNGAANFGKIGAITLTVDSTTDYSVDLSIDSFGTNGACFRVNKAGECYNIPTPTPTATFTHTSTQTPTVTPTNTVVPETNTVTPETNTVVATNTVVPETNSVTPTTNTVAVNTNTVVPETNTVTPVATNTVVPEMNASRESASLNFQVQIGAFRNEISVDRIASIYGINDNIRTDMHEGYTKFLIGSYPEYKGARDKRENVKGKVSGAFVTVYNNGKRITVQEALMISNQKWLR